MRAGGAVLAVGAGGAGGTGGAVGTGDAGGAVRTDAAVTSGGSLGRPPATASCAQDTSADPQRTVEEGTSAEGGGVGIARTTDLEPDSQATQINQSQRPSFIGGGWHHGLCVPPMHVSLRCNSEPKLGAGAAGAKGQQDGWL